MSKNLIITLSVFVVLLISGLTVFNTYRSTFDKNVELKNAFKAQKNVIAGNYDKMWKVLKQKANVTEQAAAAFKDIYVPMIEGRYSKGDGSLMKWVTEQNPQFDQSIFKDLMQSIEALRSIKEQHDNLRERFWSHIFLGNEPELEYQMITSTQTQEVVKSGKDDIDLFDKKDDKK